MKQLRRWTQDVVLAGGMGLSVLLAAVAPALALSPEAIARKLNNVPVFTLFNPQLNKFAVASLSVEGETVSLVPTYVDRADAEKLLQNQRRENASAAKDVEVRSIPLSLIYLESQSTQRVETDPAFQVLPDEAAIKAAVALRRKAGETVENWIGIPLFYAPSLGITLKDNKGQTKQVLPMYFSRTDLENYLQEAKKETPALKQSEIPVLVTTLDRVLQTLSTSDDPAMEQVEFVPPKASIEYVINQQRRNPAPQSR